MKGKVKFFNRKKGFGFITGEDDKDYFVHFTGVKKGIFLREGDSVTFDPTEGDRGLKAENVALDQSEESAPRAARETPAEEGEESEEEISDDESLDGDSEDESSDEEDSSEDRF